MTKLVLATVDNLENQTTAVGTINSNSTAISAALENTLSRDGTSPNTMTADIDMNSHTLLNLTDPTNNQNPVTLAYGNAHYGNSLNSANAAAASAAAASASQTAAATSASNASTSETNAAASASAASASATSASGSASSAATSATNAAASAGVIGAQWTFDTTVTMADPGTGKIRFNNATVASVTAVAVSATDAESGNPNIRNYILTWDDSTNATKGYLVLRKLGTPSTYAIFSVTGTITDNTTWLQLAVTYVSSNGAWSAADTAVAGFTRAGDKGIDGNVTGPGVSVDSEIALWSGTTGTTLKRASTTGILKGASGVISAAVAGTDYLAPAAIGVTVQGYDAATLKSNISASLSVGYYDADSNQGTKSTGTFTPDPSTNPNMIYYTNGGAHTLAPWTATNKNATMVIDIINGASSGAVTTTGWTKVDGDAFDTTSTSKFRCYASVGQAGSHLNVKKMA